MVRCKVVEKRRETRYTPSSVDRCGAHCNEDRVIEVVTGPRNLAVEAMVIIQVKHKVIVGAGARGKGQAGMSRWNNNKVGGIEEGDVACK